MITWISNSIIIVGFITLSVTQLPVDFVPDLTKFVSSVDIASLFLLDLANSLYKCNNEECLLVLFINMYGCVYVCALFKLLQVWVASLYVHEYKLPY